jgi:hypothetical protein
VNRPPRSLPRVVIPVLVVVAIVGYLVGIHRTPASSTTAPGEPQRIASGASLLLEYPQRWQPASSAPTFPGLSIAHRLLLAPGGKSADAGLIGGQLPTGGSSPLPASFIALVHVVPDVEVLTLEHVQAYRFSRLTGYERTLDVYVIPTVGGSPTTLVCYASNRFSSYLEQCERIVASVTLVGQTSYSLSPNAAYASERLTVRRQIRASTTPARLSALATTLADHFASAASSLAALEAPQAATAAQAALATAMVAAHSAYAELASAATAGDPDGYSVAAQRVAAAEAGVDTALENFALLGYNHT